MATISKKGKKWQVQTGRADHKPIRRTFTNKDAVPAQRNVVAPLRRTPQRRRSARARQPPGARCRAAQVAEGVAEGAGVGIGHLGQPPSHSDGRSGFLVWATDGKTVNAKTDSDSHPMASCMAPHEAAKLAMEAAAAAKIR